MRLAPEGKKAKLTLEHIAHPDAIGNAKIVAKEHGMTQSAVSQQLEVLRENGLATYAAREPEGSTRSMRGPR